MRSLRITVKKKRNLLLKLDLEKAYDCADWDIVDYFMACKGFGLMQIVDMWIPYFVTLLIKLIHPRVFIHHTQIKTRGPTFPFPFLF